jgi:DNA-binding response OmpR family regulator
LKIIEDNIMNGLSKKSLLLADNDPDYRHSLRALLELENWQVEDADSVKQALDKLEILLPDLMLVDLRLSNDKDDYDISGLEVAKKAVEKHISCIIITAFPSVDATRLALRRRGDIPLADDFVPKVAGPHAILDAINIVMSNSHEKSEKTSHELRIDLDQKLVWYKGEIVDLSKLQYTLLAYLSRKENIVCSPEELLKEVYGEDVPAEQAGLDRRLEHLVERLQEKIEDDPSKPRHLIKVPRRGVRFIV